MDFRILGPLEVVDDGRRLPIGQGRESALLALLLLRANEVIAADVLIEELWRGEPPATGAKSLQVYVSRLRKRLGADVIATRVPGYSVRVGRDQLDLLRFERLVEEARGVEAPEAAAATLRDALSLWRGPPLAEFANEAWAQPEIGRLEELRLAALEDRIDADLALGRHADVVGELEVLVSGNPYRERLCGQLMLALYRSGRQAEALAAYRDTRRVLDEELGLEPGQELRELERRILAQDERLSAPRALHEEAEATSGPRIRRRRRLVVLAALVALALAAGIGTAAVGLGRSAPQGVVAERSSVALIDPARNRVVDAIRVADRPTRIAVRGNAVWVLHPDIRTLTLVDRAERKVLRTVGLGGAPSGLAVDRHGVWVTDARTGDLILIDPERLTVVKTITTRARPVPLRDSDAGSVAVGFGSIWFASGERTISRIDPDTGRVVTRIRQVDTGESLGGIVVGAGSVWVAGPLPGVDGDAHRPAQERDRGKDPRPEVPVERDRARRRLDLGLRCGKRSGMGDRCRTETSLWGRRGLVGSHSRSRMPQVRSGLPTRATAPSHALTRRRRHVVATIPVGGSPNGIAATADGIWVTVD